MICRLWARYCAEHGPCIHSHLIFQHPSVRGILVTPCFQTWKLKISGKKKKKPHSSSMVELDWEPSRPSPELILLTLVGSRSYTTAFTISVHVTLMCVDLTQKPPSSSGLPYLLPFHAFLSLHRTSPAHLHPLAHSPSPACHRHTLGPF